MTQALPFGELRLDTPLVGNDTIEVVDEVNRLVYVFLATTDVTAEQLVEDWATSGDPTWSMTRPASDEDLVNASAALQTSAGPLGS